jgi:hypothetical protein
MCDRSCSYFSLDIPGIPLKSEMQEIALLALVIQADPTQSRRVNKALFILFYCIDPAAFKVSNRGAKKRVFTY